MKAIRILFALPFLLGGLGMFAAMIFEFGKGVVTWSLSSILMAFLFMAISATLLFVGSLLTPKPSTTTKPAKPVQKTEPFTIGSTDDRAVRAMSIPADPSEPVGFVSVGPDLRSSQEYVGGFVEAVGRGLDWVALADEDGKAKGKPYNARATHAMGFMSGHNMNDPITGDVLVMGTAKDGSATDLPNQVAGQVETIAGEVSA